MVESENIYHGKLDACRKSLSAIGRRKCWMKRYTEDLFNSRSVNAARSLDATVYYFVSILIKVSLAVTSGSGYIISGECRRMRLARRTDHVDVRRCCSCITWNCRCYA